jgi:hypothetical protein
MSLIASDGYEYEDLKARLLGQPKDCPRNKIISFHHRQGKSEGFVQAWIKGYDADTSPSHQRRQHNAQVATNLWLHANISRNRTGEPTPVSPPPAPLHSADQPPVPRGLGP